MTLTITIKMEMVPYSTEYERLKLADDIVRDIKRDLKKWENRATVQFVEGVMEKK